MECSDGDVQAVTGLADPARARLYQAVARSSGPVGRDEAASAAGIGRPLAAYHLDRLVALGLLTATYQRLAGRAGPGAGRPAKVYAPSGREFAVSVPPREYELAARLLAAVVDSGGGESRSKLRDVAREFGRDLGARSRSAGPAKAGVRPAVEAVLRQYGFEPSTAEDGTVELRNCPFHQLVASHQELVCGMNLALMQGVISGIGAVGAHPSLDPKPGRCCVVVGSKRQPGDLATEELS